MTTQAVIDYDVLVQADRIHGSVYLNAQIFAEDMEKIFHREWVCVAHASEVPEPGDYRLKQIERQSVIMTRDEDGQVHLLMNPCTHRANAVCQAEHGNAHFFRCAYHGWTFRNNGELVGVTYQTAMIRVSLRKITA